MSHAILN
ncbi:hypothetical protein MTR67_002011 [Solanum verrucosum]|nr:hypothetical protein MTR67_002011 [Solanum verrucosum]